MNHPVLVLRRRSDRADLLGPRALGTAADGELDPLVFLKAAVTASLDGGMVDEEVGRAVRNCQYLWMRKFQAAAASSVLVAVGDGLLASGD